MSLKWIAADELDTNAEIASIVDLCTKVRNISESEAFSTPACRAFIIGQTGKFADRRAMGRHPLTLEWAHKLSKMLNTTPWNEDYAVDNSANTIVELFRDVSDPYLDMEVHDNLWGYGVVFARSYDTKNRVHYPETTSVYRDDTSVLRDLPTVIGATLLDKLAYRAWVKFSPTSAKTDAKLIEDSVKFMQAQALAYFGNKRFTYVCDVKLTPVDVASGRSWTFVNNLYAQKSRDTAYTSVSVYRMSDLATN
jgi:hypothetical protein